MSAQLLATPGIGMDKEIGDAGAVSRAIQQMQSRYRRRLMRFVPIKRTTALQMHAT
jgi:hypothetical protein